MQDQGLVSRAICWVIGVLIFVLVYSLTMEVIDSMARSEEASRNKRIYEFYRERWMITK